MVNEDIVLAYSNIANEYAEAFYHELDNKPIDRKLYDLFADRIPLNGNCLEIGCGPGEISLYLHEKGLHITGIDKSQAMITIAKKLNNNIQFKIDDVFNLSFESDSIDGIVAPFLIVNFTNKEIKLALQEIYRILKHDSILLLTFHIGRNKKLQLNDYFKKNNKIIFTLHSLENVKNIISKCGFIITEVVVKSPYESEQTTRAFIYAKKKDFV